MTLEFTSDIEKLRKENDELLKKLEVLHEEV